MQISYIDLHLKKKKKIVIKRSDGPCDELVTGLVLPNLLPYNS